MAVALRSVVPVLLVITAAGCARNVKTIPPVLEGISLLGDTLWSVPVPIQGGRERVARLQDARERHNHSPGDFIAAYDVARYTADLGRYTQAITLFGDAAALGGLDPRPYARRGELYLLLRKVERGYSDLRTAERLASGDPFLEQQVTGTGEMQPRALPYMVPHLLGIASLVRGEPARAAEYFGTSAGEVESLREAIQTTLWFRVSRPGADFPSALPTRYRPAVTTLLTNATRGVSPTACPPPVAGSLVDADLLCLGRATRFLADGKREDAVAALDLIRRRSHWSSRAHLAAEAATARLQMGSEAATVGDRKTGRTGSS